MAAAERLPSLRFRLIRPPLCDIFVHVIVHKLIKISNRPAFLVPCTTLAYNRTTIQNFTVTEDGYDLPDRDLRR